MMALSINTIGFLIRNRKHYGLILLLQYDDGSAVFCISGGRANGQNLFYEKQARQFLLLKHGLLGDYKFVGKEGILSFIRQAGCIQFDPVDVCGRNADLVLQSRIKDYQKDDAL